jgi:hypothetical protein
LAVTLRRANFFAFTGADPCSCLREVSKTRKTRRFELTGLLDGVVEWLKPHAKESGSVYGHTESTFNKDIAAAEELVG